MKKKHEKKPKPTTNMSYLMKNDTASPPCTLPFVKLDSSTVVAFCLANFYSQCQSVTDGLLILFFLNMLESQSKNTQNSTAV